MKRRALLARDCLLAFRPAGARCRASSNDDDQETSHQFHSLIWPATAQLFRANRLPISPGRPIHRRRSKFKDLWNRPDVFRGRRVTVQGRVVRIFRQGPVGSFPAARRSLDHVAGWRSLLRGISAGQARLMAVHAAARNAGNLPDGKFRAPAVEPISCPTRAGRSASRALS